MQRSAASQITAADPRIAQFAADVAYYLMQVPRQLPSRYLYDALGSALFDAICWLPSYRITQSETSLLARHGSAIFGHVPRVSTLVELGPGSGAKLRTLLDAAGPLPSRLAVHLIDVSADALARAARTLTSGDDVVVVGHEASYEHGLSEMATDPTVAPRTLVLFLGSNIGNFDPPAADAFVRAIRAALAPGDALLVGADLVKPERELLLAYDDPLGVTAAFNRNLLVRINRELDADFDIQRFAHRAVWNAQRSRVEMHLVADALQRIHVAAAKLDFEMAAGDLIWTESSYKYRADEIAGLLERGGFDLLAQWIDPDAQFALTLVKAD